MISIPEDTVEQIDPVELQRQQYLHPGEVFITNSADENSDFWKRRSHTQDEKSGQQFASELLSYGDKGKWETVRVVNQAFDKDGKLVKGMVMLVGKARPQG